MKRRTILIVEDGSEYTEAFRRLALTEQTGIDLLRAGDAHEAGRLLGQQTVDAIFLDVVFDRTPPDRLAGDSRALEERFAGDRARAQQHLARRQGFYIADAIADRIPKNIPVVLAFDFSAEPERLAALRQRLPRLEGIAEGTAITEVLNRLRRDMSDLA
jgi:CheY-like chemotaxis protein